MEIAQIKYLIPLLLLVKNLYGQTEVNENITSDVIWTLEESPYIVTNDIEVSNEGSLFIEPGVTVKVDGEYTIDVYGEFSSSGTTEQPIVFTSNKSNPEVGDWLGIKLNHNWIPEENKYRDYTFEHCIIEYVLEGISSKDLITVNNCIIRNSTQGLRISVDKGQDGEPMNCVIANSKFYNNEYGILVTSTWTIPSSDTLKIINNEIFDNKVDGIRLIQNASNYTILEIRGNRIVNNSEFGIKTLMHARSGGRDDGDEFPVEFLPTVIIENLIANNTLGGLYGGGIVPVTITFNYLIHNGGFGIKFAPYEYSVNRDLVYPRDVKIINNLILEASIAAIQLSSQGDTISSNTILDSNIGIKFAFDQGSQLTHKNLLNQLSIGIVIGDKSSPIHKDSTSMNTFRNMDYFIKNYASTVHIQAVDNYWNSLSDSLSIVEKIEDSSDNANYGIVTFLPSLSFPNTASPISPPDNVTSRYLENTTHIEWEPNTEQDLVGYIVYYGKIDEITYEYSLDVGNVTSIEISDVQPNQEIAVTAYDTNYDKEKLLNQLNGFESWFSVAQSTPINVLGTKSIRAQLDIYPNPARDFIRVISQNSQLLSYKLMTLAGNVVLFGELTGDDVIRLNEITSGVYLLTIYSIEGNTIKRIVKK